MMKSKSTGVILSIFLASVIICCEAELDVILYHYETLHHSHVTHHVTKRSVAGRDATTKEISFTVLDRHFRLHLQRQRNLFAKDFEAFVIDGDNEEKKFAFDTSKFYEGFVVGEPDTTDVRAYWEDDDLVATVRTTNDTYVVEPAWRHLAPSDNYSMIAYKASDVKGQGTNPFGSRRSYCGFVHPHVDDAAYEDTEQQDGSRDGRRRKRAAGIKGYNTCPLTLIADHHFFQNAGRGSVSSVVNYMVGVIARVDDLYRAVDFGEGYSNVGFEIRDIIVHKTPTAVKGGEEHYNMAKDSWDAAQFLSVFSKGPNWESYCLAHLFTYLAFDGVLGMGNIASPIAGYPGGICSTGSKPHYYNTAWTTTLSRGNRRILTQEADLVTAHEFGHNWGSHHDTSACSPSSKDGGKYLMYPFSVSGYESNNDKFSTCSKANILAVLKNKIRKCFTERSNAYCGNYAVEGDEECDGGVDGIKGKDQCCNSKCRFRDKAVCSDANSKCCSGCQFASKTTVCRDTTNLTTSCEGNAYCTGSDATCPISSSNKPDGTECIESGTCRDGKCVAFCESNRLKSCICDTVETACKWCCRNETMQGPCEPYPGALNLPDGKPCVQGFCKQGTCEKKILKLGDRIWSIVNNLSVDAFLLFLRNNLVLTTIVLSLLLYVPMCIIVACLDYRSEKKDKKRLAWYSSDNDNVVAPGGRPNIFRTYRRRRQPDGFGSSTASVSKVAVGPM